jgi:hypothetical protein
MIDLAISNLNMMTFTLSSSPMVPVLPPELLRSIISHISDNRSLISLLVSSRSFHDETEAILYRTFTTQRTPANTRRDGCLTPSAFGIAFLNRVKESDRVASYVYNCNIIAPTWLPEFWEMVNIALPRMRNLESLGKYPSTEPSNSYL